MAASVMKISARRADVIESLSMPASLLQTLATIIRRLISVAANAGQQFWSCCASHSLAPQPMTAFTWVNLTSFTSTYNGFMLVLSELSKAISRIAMPWMLTGINASKHFKRGTFFNVPTNSGSNIARWDPIHLWSRIVNINRAWCGFSAIT